MNAMHATPSTSSTGGTGVERREVGCQSEGVERRDAAVQVNLLPQLLSWNTAGRGALLQNCTTQNQKTDSYRLDTGPQNNPYLLDKNQLSPVIHSRQLPDKPSKTMLLPHQTPPSITSQPPAGLIAPLSPRHAEEEEEEDDDEDDEQQDEEEEERMEVKVEKGGQWNTHDNIKRLGTLRVHRQNVHTEAKSEHPAELSVYVQTHTPVKPYSCEVCGKSFQTVYNRDQHKKNVHRITSVCQVCGKVLKSMSLLAVHSRVHTEERPHACEICGRSFKHHRNLKTHKTCIHGSRDKGYAKETDSIITVEKASDANGAVSAKEANYAYGDAKEVSYTAVSPNNDIYTENAFNTNLDKNGNGATNALASSANHDAQGGSVATASHASSMLTRKGLRDHLELGKDFFCLECLESFYTATDLQRHTERRHRGGEERRMKHKRGRPRKHGLQSNSRDSSLTDRQADHTVRQTDSSNIHTHLPAQLDLADRQIDHTYTQPSMPVASQTDTPMSAVNNGNRRGRKRKIPENVASYWRHIKMKDRPLITLTNTPSPSRRTQLDPREPSLPRRTQLDPGEPSLPRRTQLDPGEPSLPRRTQLDPGEPSLPRRTQLDPGEPSLPRRTQLESGEPSLPRRTQLESGEPSLPRTTSAVNNGNRRGRKRKIPENVASYWRCVKMKDSLPRRTQLDPGEPSLPRRTQLDSREPQTYPPTPGVKQDTGRGSPEKAALNSEAKFFNSLDFRQTSSPLTSGPCVPSSHYPGPFHLTDTQTATVKRQRGRPRKIQLDSEMRSCGLIDTQNPTQNTEPESLRNPMDRRTDLSALMKPCSVRLEPLPLRLQRTQ
ncbi:uncharacterized protein ACJ7VT_016257 [Polymixia lowei]